MIIPLQALIPALAFFQGGGAPPNELSGGASLDVMETVLPLNYIEGAPGHLMYGREVQIAYALSQSGPMDDVLDRELLSIPVSYTPTFVAFMDDKYLAVGGKRSQRTLIEVWKVTPPTIDEAPGVSATEFQTSPGLRTSVVVFDETIPGMDLVRLLVRNRGKSDTVFVQFHDSRDIYELDYSDAIPPEPGSPTYPITKVLSSTSGAGVPHVPELADSRLNWVQSRHHVAEGYVYLLLPSFDVQLSSTPTEVPPLWMFDHDLDGDIDETVVLTSAQAAARGLHGVTNYFDQGMATKMWNP